MILLSLYKYINFIYELMFARVAELVDALDLGSSTLVCESSSLSSRNLKLILGQ